MAEARKFQEDPHWRDLILFYEYFHGDNGAGLGASHQTGWTGIIARAMHLFATTTAEQVLRARQESRSLSRDRHARVGANRSVMEAAGLSRPRRDVSSP